jgi:hypothetical protein
MEAAHQHTSTFCSDFFSHPHTHHLALFPQTLFYPAAAAFFSLSLSMWAELKKYPEKRSLCTELLAAAVKN